MLSTHTRWIAAITILAFALPAFAEKDGWSTDYKKALKESKETGKPILAEFTGSDWCGFCIKQNKEVFSTDEFKAWAEEHVILLELDFPTPKKREEMSEELKEQNAKLKEKFGVGGYPTVVFLGHNEVELSRLVGYPSGGAKKWIKKANEIVEDYDPNAEPGKYTPGKWIEDYKAALAASRKMGKPVFVNFTGSDWCPPCMQLKKNVLSSGEFTKWAKKNVILLELDFPRRSEQDAQIKKQNQKLARKYSISGYPTVMIIDHDGKVLGRTGGYGGQKPADYVDGVMEFVKKYEPSKEYVEAQEKKQELESEETAATDNG